MTNCKQLVVKCVFVAKKCRTVQFWKRSPLLKEVCILHRCPKGFSFSILSCAEASAKHGQIKPQNASDVPFAVGLFNTFHSVNCFTRTRSVGDLELRWWEIKGERERRAIGVWSIFKRFPRVLTCPDQKRPTGRASCSHKQRPLMLLPCFPCWPPVCAWQGAVTKFVRFIYFKYCDDCAHCINENMDAVSFIYVQIHHQMLCLKSFPSWM